MTEKIVHKSTVQRNIDAVIMLPDTRISVYKLFPNRGDRKAA